MSNLFVDTSGWASLFINTQPYYLQTEQYSHFAVQQYNTRQSLRCKKS